jgi:hypothetical protein
MSEKSTTREQFAAIYNDLKKYPTLTEVSNALGVTIKTVSNRAAVIRASVNAPKLIARGTVTVTKSRTKPSPKQHSDNRATSLQSAISDLVMRSRYPLINPEAIVIDPHVSSRYDRLLGVHVEKEGTPRTWLSDTLRVEPISDSKGKKFLFTGAQNDAQLHEAFWHNLKAYAKEINAEIVIGPWTYETQWWSENNPSSREYDSELSDYLCFGQMEIGDNFVFCGEMNTLPTASAPISDLVTYSRGRWAVFPHAKRQLKSVASTDPSVQAHQVMTTGAVTIPKVIPRKAGVKSIFHHVIGATLVEFDQDGDVFCRQITASESGSFYDLDKFVAGGVITQNNRVRSIVFGDIHTEKLGPVVAAASFGLNVQTGKIVNQTNILDVLRPEYAFLHDVFDGQTRNHHAEGDTAQNYELAFRERDSVIKEVENAADFLINLKRTDTLFMVVDSNHDLFLEKYVRDGKYRNDGKNFKIGLELDLAYTNYREEVGLALNAHQPVPSFSLFEAAVGKVRDASLLSHVEWVHDGKSFVVENVECGHHGFRGSNGSRGSVIGFARMGHKMTIGHIHSPEISDGVYGVGVCELQHGYNKGPSSWATAHCVQYPDGHRTMITLQNGKWRA